MLTHCWNRTLVVGRGTESFSPEVGKVVASEIRSTKNTEHLKSQRFTRVWAPEKS